MPNYFQTNVFILRKNKGETQEETAIALGLKRNTLSNYETGHSEPDIENILKISSYFDVSAEDLLGIDLSKVRFVEKKDAAKIDKKGKVQGKDWGKVQGLKGADYPQNEPSPMVLQDSQLNTVQSAFNQELIANYKQTIDSLKQANGALSSLIEAHKATITRLQAEIIELKQKTGPK